MIIKAMITPFVLVPFIPDIGVMLFMINHKIRTLLPPPHEIFTGQGISIESIRISSNSRSSACEVVAPIRIRSAWVVQVPELNPANGPPKG
jgi:hypothetical protein